MWKLVYYSIAAVLSSVMAVPLQRLSSERYIMRSWDRPYSSPTCDNKESMCQIMGPTGASRKGPQIEAGLIPADLFAIVKTTEKLERAYVRDAISAKDYEAPV